MKSHFNLVNISEKLYIINNQEWSVLRNEKNEDR